MTQHKITPKTAVAVILAVSGVLAWMVVSTAAASGPFGNTSVDSIEDAAEFLLGLGWDTDPEKGTRQTVVLPTTFDNVYTRYNELQKMQGSDLTPYAGKEVIVYTLPVTNYAGSDSTVYAVVMVYGGKVIGGDIHAAALDGFMHGLK